MTVEEVIDGFGDGIGHFLLICKTYHRKFSSCNNFTFLRERLRDWGACKVLFVFEVHVSSRKTYHVLSLRTMYRLWLRFLQTSAVIECSLGHDIVTRCMVTEACTKDAVTLFTNSVTACVAEKARALREGCSTTMYSVTPIFYETWMAMARFDCELFADAINESGIAREFCSLDHIDEDFGSCGSWESADAKIWGGVGNPPYDVTFISRMMTTFETGVQHRSPYFRACILPGGSTYDVERKLLTCGPRGAVIAYIPENELGFVHQESLLSAQTRLPFAKPLRKQKLLLCVWINREYLAERPPPADVKEVIAEFILHACRSPGNCKIYYSKIRELFPLELRSSRSVAHTTRVQAPSCHICPPAVTLCNTEVFSTRKF